MIQSPQQRYGEISKFVAIMFLSPNNPFPPVTGRINLFRSRFYLPIYASCQPLPYHPFHLCLPLLLHINLHLQICHHLRIYINPCLNIHLCPTFSFPILPFLCLHISPTRELLSIFLPLTHHLATYIQHHILPTHLSLYNYLFI